MLAGASAVQVGTAIFIEPDSPLGLFRDLMPILIKTVLHLHLTLLEHLSSMAESMEHGGGVIFTLISAKRM